MENCEDALKFFTDLIRATVSSAENKEEINEIPVGISNRHIHLSQTDMYYLFGEQYQLSKLKELSQPGQYACKETLIICGPKGSIEKVRVLGPTRSKTQVEILVGDCFKLGISPQIKLSGDLYGTYGITLVGPKGSVQLKEGVIVAQRHIHMNIEDTKRFNVYDGQIVSVEVNGERSGIYGNVAIRANDTSILECHIDTEEANAMCVNSSSKVRIIK